MVLTPFVLPGEVASVEIKSEKTDLVRASLRQVVSPAAGRVAPMCRYFERCGGCQYQHADYALQVTHKCEILREQLRRVGRIPYDGEIASVAGPPYGYRNRTRFHIEGRRIGFYLGTSHHLLPIEQCPVSSPKINDALAALRRMSRDPRFPNFLRDIEFFTDESAVQINVQHARRPLARRFFDWCAEEIGGLVEGPLEYAAAGDRFRVSGQSFFQVNRFLIDELVDAALSGESGSRAVDLYAGAGLFTLRLARSFDSACAVEQSGSAAADLEYNARLAGVTVQSERKRVEDYLAGAGANGAPDLVVADPPRSGLGKSAAARLAALKPRAIALISCDPATLARDLSVLLAAGYAIEKLVMIDLFPQTYHLETVARLRLT